MPKLVTVGVSSAFPIIQGIFTGDDGITWTGRSSCFDFNNASANNGHAYCACSNSDGTVVLVGGDFGTLGKAHPSSPTPNSPYPLARSTDRGLTWTNPTIAGFTQSGGTICIPIWAIAWSAERGLFMAVGATQGGAQAVATSPDGVTWTTRANPGFAGTSNSNNAVIYAGGRWLIGGHGASSPFHIFAYSTDDGATWTRVFTAFASTGTIRGFAFDGTSVVAGGNKQTGTSTQPIETATDPTNSASWTLRTTPFTGGGPCTGVIWVRSLGLFIAVGEDSGFTVAIITSPDGATWTGRGNSVEGGQGVCWQADLAQAVAVGQSPTTPVATSPDGITWTGRSGSFLGASGVRGVYAVAYIPPDLTRADLVVVGEAIDSAKSIFVTDDVTKPDYWRLKSSVFDLNDAASNNGQVWSVASNGNGTIVAVGDFGTAGVSNAGANPAGSKYPIARGSGDGKTWTNPTIASFAGPSTGLPIKGVAWSAARGLFMAVGGVVGSSGRVATSPDGTTWTDRNSTAPFFIGVNRQPNCIVYGAGVWLMGAKGVKDVAYSSDDGVSWTNVTIFGSNANVNRIAWNGSLFVMAWDGGVKTSPDGITWTDRGSPLGAPVNSVTWSDTLALWVIVGASSGAGAPTIATSPDGATWTTRGDPSGGTDLFADVVWQANSSRFAAVGRGTSKIFTSPDGTTWTDRGRSAALSGTIQINAMAYHPPPPNVSFSGAVSSSGVVSNLKVKLLSASGATTPSGTLTNVRVPAVAPVHGVPGFIYS